LYTYLVKWPLWAWGVVYSLDGALVNLIVHLHASLSPV
jgi:hypothetical protein